MQEIRKADPASAVIGLRAKLVSTFSPARWLSWQQASVNRRIFSAMLTVGMLTLLVKSAATFKEMVIARKLGVADSLDAYLVAFALPAFVMNLITGTLNSVLIPAYVQVRDQDGQGAAQKLLSSVTVWIALLLTVVSILMGLTGPYALQFIGSSFDADKMALTRTLFFVLLPTIVLSGIATTWSAVLNAGERFALTAATPIATPLMLMLFVYFSGVAWQPFALVLGTVTGEALRCALLARGLKRQGVSVLPRWHGSSAALIQIRNQCAPMIAGSCLTCSSLLVDQSMAAMLGAGSVSVLNYSSKIVAVVVAIGSVALTTAVLPQFSRMAAADDWAGIKSVLRTYIPLILVTTLPATAILILCSKPLVSLLFVGGAFTNEDAQEVVRVQSLYLLQLPFYTLVNLLIRLIASMKANHVLMRGAAINFAFNIGLDYLLMRWLGVAGIALSTSIVYMLSLCYLSFMLTRLFKQRTSAER
ncbi:MAG TPA: lipid II flippase MurJ [Blastocatellia bacterium]|nr:lipid II flippase MurJ [Blastocatellia bacterium]